MIAKNKHTHKAIPTSFSKHFERKVDNSFSHPLFLSMLLCRRRDYYFNPRNPDPTPFIFILCQDNKTSLDAKKVYSSYSWAYMYELPTTLLEEFYFITNHLEDLLHLANTNTHWIGFLPWMGNMNFNLTLVDEMLGDKALKDDGADVLIFSTVNTATEKSLSKIMKEKLEYVLLSNGETNDRLSSDWNRYANVHNLYYTSTLELMRSFIPWITRILIFTQTDDNAHKNLTDWTSFTKSLATYFFMTRGTKVVSMTDYENILEERRKETLKTEKYAMHNQKMIESLQT